MAESVSSMHAPNLICDQQLHCADMPLLDNMSGHGLRIVCPGCIGRPGQAASTDQAAAGMAVLHLCSSQPAH